MKKIILVIPLLLAALCASAQDAGADNQKSDAAFLKNGQAVQLEKDKTYSFIMPPDLNVRAGESFTRSVTSDGVRIDFKFSFAKEKSGVMDVTASSEGKLPRAFVTFFDFPDSLQMLIAEENKKETILKLIEHPKLIPPQEIKLDLAQIKIAPEDLNMHLVIPLENLKKAVK